MGGRPHGAHECPVLCCQVRLGDPVVVRSAVVAVTTKTLRFRQVMMNCVTDEEAASTEPVPVHTDLGNHHAHPFPDPIRERVQEMVASQADR